MKNLLIILCLFSTAIALGQTKVEIRKDSALTKIFNEKEIKGIESMIQFVDKMVKNEESTNNINEAFHHFFDKIATAHEYEAPFKEEVKYAFLKSLDSVQFSTIWNFDLDSNTAVRINDTLYRDLDSLITLELNPFSKYVNYLKETGKSDSYYLGLYNELINVGNITQDSYEWFLKNHENFDFSIIKNRIWAMVYILRMEETIERKIKRIGKF